MNRSEVYFLMKLVEKANTPPWVDKNELIKKLQDLWIEKIHNKVA